jgi:hypothetical protein
MAKATKAAQGNDQDTKAKASYDLKVTTIKKLKHISAFEDRFQNDILEELLSDFFVRWEKDNHKIPIKK